MGKIKDFFSRIQLVYRRSSNTTKIIVIAAIVLCTATLIVLRLAITDLENRTEDLRNKAGYLEYENQNLQDKIDGLGSVQSIIDIAEEELGLVQPGSVAFETEPAN